MSEVRVEQAESKAAVKAFVDHPYRRYRDDPVWVPPLRVSQLDALDEAKNPLWQHADRKLLLAKRDGRVVGRVAYILDHEHMRIHAERVAFFGFFEADDLEVARALLNAVEARAMADGMTAVRGPINGTMNDGAGFQLDGYDQRAYVLMPQNPPEYPAWMAELGYGKVKDLYTFYFDNRVPMPERFSRLAERVRSRNDVTVRPADMRRFDSEVELLKRIHTAAWEKNWGNVPLSEAEMDHLAKDLKMIIDPELVLFLERAGEPVALAVTVPDLNQVLARFDGRLFPFGIFHLLRRKSIIDRARLVMLGVLPEHRNKGFELLLIYEVVNRAKLRGIVEGECGWTLEDNVSINHGIEAAGGVHDKTYRIFQKEL